MITEYGQSSREIASVFQAYFPIANDPLHDSHFQDLGADLLSHFPGIPKTWILDRDVKIHRTHPGPFSFCLFLLPKIHCRSVMQFQFGWRYTARSLDPVI